MRQYATGRPDEKDIEELQGFAETIFEKLAAGKLTASAPELPGNRPYKKAGGAGLVPKADKKCYRLRPLRKKLSRPSDRPQKPQNRGRQEVYFLYALCCEMPGVRPESKQRNGFRRGAGAQEGLQREKGQ